MKIKFPKICERKWHNYFEKINLCIFNQGRMSTKYLKENICRKLLIDKNYFSTGIIHMSGHKTNIYNICYCLYTLWFNKMLC